MITVQTGILAFIMYKFVKTFVENAQLHVHFPKLIWLLRGFYLSMAAVLLANLLQGVIAGNYFMCDQVKYKFNWYVTVSINTIICYLNIINGFIIFRMRKHVDRNEYYSVSKYDKSRIKTQMMILIFGYAFVSTLTLIWFIVFPQIIGSSQITCINDNRFWIPKSEGAGTAALIKSYLLLSPTVLFWLCFFWYRAPNKMPGGAISIKRLRSTLIGTDNPDMPLEKGNLALMENPNLSGNFEDINRSRITSMSRKTTAFNKDRSTSKSFADLSKDENDDGMI